jgi:hypothetical protein
MLFNNLLEARVVQLGELGQIVDVGNNITENLFQHQEVRIGGDWTRRPYTLTTSIGGVFQTGDDIGHLKLNVLNAAHNLLTLALLEYEDFLQLALEQGDKVRLIVLSPFFAGGLGVLGGRFVDKVGLKSFFEVVVGDIEGIVLLDHGRTEILTEPVKQLG